MSDFLNFAFGAVSYLGELMEDLGSESSRPSAGSSVQSPYSFPHTIPEYTPYAIPHTEAPAVSQPEPQLRSVCFSHADYTYRGRSYHFRFEYCWSDETGYRAYIVESPSYGLRSKSLVKTHRIYDGDRHYICWAGTVSTVKQMDAVAELWAKATVMYIADGGRSIDKYVSAFQ